MASSTGGKDLGVIVEKLTSEAYSLKNPPKDWADTVLLYPHEAIRHQMMALVKNVAALKADEESNNSWKTVYFCKWLVQYFYVMVHEHHLSEEEIYFPFLQTRSEIPEKEYGASHKELMLQLDVMRDLADNVVVKKGVDVGNEITELKRLVPSFVKEMNKHLLEEEQAIPPILREHFTEDENEKAVEKVIQKGGLNLARVEVPAIVEALHEWGTENAVQDFYSKMPPPILHLVMTYYEPDYETYVKPLRDAPMLKEDMAEASVELHRTPCCKIPGCFPSIL
jgi:hemerythrin superfamily protein